MSFTDLQSYLRALESAGELHRTDVPIDPALELTEVAMRARKEGKPALLVQHPGKSAFPLVISHFSSPRRIELALGAHPDQIGSSLISFLEKVMPPSARTLWEESGMVKRFFKARPRTVSSGVSQQVVHEPDLDALPVQTCWPGDGGRFITYPQVITRDPRTGKRNIGTYRMHVFDARTTGMHWQIQKGGGFHYHRAERDGARFDCAVALGTSPALTMATIAALPEGIDEALFAGFLGNHRIAVTRGRTVDLFVPAEAEFVLEGYVPPAERRMEGPFGDHFGHYSAASEFPVFHLTAITRKKNPVYPAIVVGKPPMEDKDLGDATQQILGPLIRLIHKEVTSLWAYYEAGFHNLLVASIEQRYQKEAMKAALGMMGTDQLSLTKCIVLVSDGVDVRNWNVVLKEIRSHFDPRHDFVMIPKVPLDTLDFTSYRMNLGSKMIIDATRKPGRPASETRTVAEPSAVNALLPVIREADSRILDAAAMDGTLVLVRVTGGGREIISKLLADPRLAGIPLIAAVSPDVDIYDRESAIWGVFTRFDCERDVLFTEQKLIGISPVYKGTMGIDATWKTGYPEPLTMPEEIVRRVDEKWGAIWK
jgi:4-hydroxybenzoate decarboxylase subunit C